MFMNAYKRAMAVLSNKPMMLWGLSLLSGLLTIVGNMAFIGVPAAGIIIGYLITCGMAKVYLDGLKGEEVSAEQLFACFNKNFLRIAGGMAWSALWVLIWSLVPIVGPVMAIIKSYSYRFVPYILVTNPDVTATQALKISMNQTNGIKGQMFLADLCFGGIAGAIYLFLFIFALIPIIGLLFGFMLFIYIILLVAFSPIFTGLYQAYFFEWRISTPYTPPYQQPYDQGYAQPQMQQPYQQTYQQPYQQ